MGVCSRSIAAALIALGLVAGPPAAAQVPDPFARELAQDLAQAELTLAEESYVRAAGPFAGGLGQRETRRITLTLRAGQEYGIVGVCDSRCGFNVRVFDPNGAPVARGMSAGGAAVMRVRPAFTGPYNVELEVTRCAAAQCWYAVNIYTR